MATRPQPPAPTLPTAAEEWSARAADAVETAVETVHDKVVRPALLAGRAVVFGVIIAVAAIVVIILLAVGLVRFLDVYAFPGRVWASYALIGVLACAGGFVLWALRSRHLPQR